MLENFKSRISRLIRHGDYKPLQSGKLAKVLGVSDADLSQFKRALEQLRSEGHVVVGARSLVSLPELATKVRGTFRANRKGFGFVIPLTPSDGDLFIPAKATAGAMTGDIVIAKVSRKGKRAGQMRYSGKVVEICQRAHDKFVGTLSKTPHGWIVQPDGTGFTEPVDVDDVAAKGAGVSDKVVVQIISYPTEDYRGRGVIVEVLGKSGCYEAEIESTIHQFHLPGPFDEQCLAEAGKAAGQFDAGQLDGREDIMDKLIITIDPATAKDFDDAISLEKDGDGNWVLGVHIADVSNFIAAASAMDVEAKERGNSVYLPGKTIPMLPEVLSNGICSLQPGQKRFTKSAYLTYDEEGNILSRRFANSVICSAKRLTYVQADRILKGHTKNMPDEVIRLLKDMEQLSKAIEGRREEEGMLHLDLPETDLIMDKAGRVVDAKPADDSYPHTMIEMFMVEANDAVAGIIDRANVPMMRRIHPEPDALSMKALAKTVRGFGVAMPKNPKRKDIQQVLAAVKGADCSLAVNLIVLRSFAKAEYAPLHIGHYALASTHYCHFTSPIRRYADLLVHRVLEVYLQGRLKKDKLDLPSTQELAEVGRHLNGTEEQADNAENDLKKVLILQMLSKKIGMEMDCVVTGLANFGIFVQCKKFGIEGLIQTQDLGPDEWKYDAKAQCITGINFNISIRLGSAMKVRVVSVNVPGRQLSVAPAEPLISEREQARKEKGVKRRQKIRKRRRSKRR